MGQVARAAPDGYTVLMALSSISVLPEADKLFGRKPAFTLNQFKPIARFTADPTVFVVRADAPWKTLAEFLADAKRKPGAFNYGSSGNYGTMHVPMEMLKADAGFRMVHIPFTGAGPAVVALLGGQVDAIASGPASVAQHVRSGRLRALAHWGEQPAARAARRAEPVEPGPSGQVRAVVGLVRARGHARRRGAASCAPRRARWPPTRRCSRPSAPRAARSSTSTRRSSRPTGTRTRRVMADVVQRIGKVE